MKQKTPNFTYIYKCDSCDKSYKQKRGLTIHKENVHERKSFECAICRKQFHLKVLIKQPYQKYACS